MEQKQRFINLAQSGRFTVSELSEEFGITRKTGHKWLLRYAGGGMKGLEERSRAPKKVSMILLRKSEEGLFGLLGFMVQGEFEVQRRFVAKSRV